MKTGCKDVLGIRFCTENLLVFAFIATIAMVIHHLHSKLCLSELVGGSGKAQLSV